MQKTLEREIVGLPDDLAERIRQRGFDIRDVSLRKITIKQDGVDGTNAWKWIGNVECDFGSSGNGRPLLVGRRRYGRRSGTCLENS